MKKLLLCSSLAATLFAATMTASASSAVSSGTIAFTGNVVASTCAITVNGNASSTPTVTLPSVSVTDFASAAGNFTGGVPVNFSLTGCPATISGLTNNKVVVYLSGTAGMVDQTTGYLVNTSGATGVEIAFKNSAGAALNLTQAAFSQGLVGQPLSTSAINFDLTAQYVSTSATPAPGSVGGTVFYDLAYN